MFISGRAVRVSGDGSRVGVGLAQGSSTPVLFAFWAGSILYLLKSFSSDALCRFRTLDAVLSSVPSLLEVLSSSSLQTSSVRGLLPSSFVPELAGRKEVPWRGHWA